LGAGVYADIPAMLAQLDYAQTEVQPVADQVELYDSYFRQVYQKIYLTLRPLHHAIYPLEHPD
jgi:hypothetical protein